MTETLDIALPKGRLGEKVARLLSEAGMGCDGLGGDSRKLVLSGGGGSLRFFWVKPADVPIYVERGAADIGVAGRDVLLESGADVYELLDLGLGKCRMCVAGYPGGLERGGVLRTIEFKRVTGAKPFDPHAARNAWFPALLERVGQPMTKVITGFHQ